MNSNLNSLSSSNLTGKPRKPTKLQAFFITCSGADKDILYQCPTEFNKYSGIGATIFFTALLASFSGGYAIYTALFDATSTVFSLNIFLITAVLGLFWGIIIFNLDRYIVLSLRKERIPTKADILNATSDYKRNELVGERSRLLWSQFLMVLPRFLIALVIALTISKPIELRLFKPRIDKELANVKTKDTGDYEKKHSAEIANLNGQLQVLNNKETGEKNIVYSSNPVYDNLTIQLNEAESAIKITSEQVVVQTNIMQKQQYLANGKKQKYNKETKEYEVIYYKYWKLNGKGKTAKKDKQKFQKQLSALNSKFEKDNEQKERLEKSFEKQVASIATQYEKQRAPIIAQIKSLQANYIPNKIKYEATLNRSSDLLSRLEALGNITHFGNSAWWASFVITLLFVLLETAPVVVKLLTKRGPYDEILERIEYKHYLEEQKTISDYNFDVNKQLQEKQKSAELQRDEFVKKEQQRIDAELKDHQQMLDGMSEKRKDLSEQAVDIWYQKELLKLQHEAKQFENAPKWKVIENQVWKNINGTDTFYCFVNRDDNQVSKELWYRNGKSLRVGNWKYLNNNTALEISISGQKEQYFITDLAQSKLGLKSLNNNGVMDLRKADNASIV